MTVPSPDFRIQDAVDLSGAPADGYVPTWSRAGGGFVYSAGTPGPTGPQGPTGVSSNHDLMLRDWGVYAETFELINITNLAPVTGRIYNGMIGLNAGLTIGHLFCQTAVAGAGTIPALVKMALVDKNLNVLALTANLASDSQLQSQIIGRFPLVTPYPVTVGAMYGVCLLEQGVWTGGGAVQWQIAFRAPGTTVTSILGGPMLFSNSSGNNDLPGVGGTLPTATSSGNQPWFAAGA